MTTGFKTVEIKDKKRLDDFIGAQPHAEFLQSWEWGGFLSAVEGKVMRFGVEENGELAAAITLVKRKLPLGMKYFYAPRGPIFNYQSSIINLQLYNFLFSEIEKISNKEKVIFLRIEPETNFQISNIKYQISKTINIQPPQTIILNLSESEEELLNAMHQKTRYNIRLAEKKGVKIREAAVDDFEIFWNLMQKTSGRDGFTPHSKFYYQKLLQTAPEIFKLFTAEYEDRVIAAGIFGFFGDTATYLYGASGEENREVMAPHLLQWELIKRAKATGYKYYDFFGIDEKKWPGVTRFKRGFGGEEIKNSETIDVVFNKIKYNIYKILRMTMRAIRKRTRKLIKF